MAHNLSKKKMTVAHEKNNTIVYALCFATSSKVAGCMDILLIQKSYMNEKSVLQKITWVYNTL